ncbi:acyltransferase [Pedobacter faecalis]|uniref:acyltransferase n=1 Tax=Pedobacter faecalis TaxID=3041495 RepID=UPI00254D3645|nr:acyltransferase [Pedobacter sp. ELA7]
MSFIKKLIKYVYWNVIRCNPLTRCIYETRGTQTPITFRYLFFQKILGINRSAYWQVHFTSIVTYPKNITVGIETSPGMMPGCYIQGMGEIVIGDYTQIAANVGIISSNHDLYDTSKHVEGKVNIGRYCWIGMNSVVLPGITLGDFTIVGAGSIVTKSFPEGHCVIAGNPAKIIKVLEREKCEGYTSRYEYNGYIPKEKFEKFKSKLKS